MTEVPERGDVWLVDLDPVRGNEQGERRPGVIVSAGRFNRGAAELVAILPISSKNKRIPLHVEVTPPEGGVRTLSFVMCDQIRTISKERLIAKWGSLSQTTMERIDDTVKVVLGL